MLKIQVEFIPLFPFSSLQSYCHTCTGKRPCRQMLIALCWYIISFLSFTPRCTVIKCMDSNYIFSVNKIACKFVKSCLENSLVLGKLWIFFFFLIYPQVQEHKSHSVLSSKCPVTSPAAEVWTTESGFYYIVEYKCICCKLELLFACSVYFASLHGAKDIYWITDNAIQYNGKACNTLCHWYRTR